MKVWKNKRDKSIPDSKLIENRQRIRTLLALFKISLLFISQKIWVKINIHRVVPNNTCKQLSIDQTYCRVTLTKNRQNPTITYDDRMIRSVTYLTAQWCGWILSARIGSAVGGVHQVIDSPRHLHLNRRIPHTLAWLMEIIFKIKNLNK